MQNISYPLAVVPNRSWLSSRPLKLLLFVLVGNLLPVYAYFTIFYGGVEEIILPNLAITVLAALAAWFFQSRLGSYSRTSRMALVMPTTFSPFAIAYFVILAARIPYSLATLVLTFAGTLAVGYFLSIVGRPRQLRRYVVPGGRVDEVFRQFGGDAVVLDKPDISRIMTAPNAHAIVIADLHCTHDPRWESFLADAALKSIPVLHYKQLWETYSGQVKVDRLSENNFGSLLPNRPYMRIKRFGDALIALLVLPFVLPLFGVLAIIIKSQSDGPVFFRQDRVGYRGEPFQMIKFRTMYDRETLLDEAARRQDSITGDGDNRVTPIGRFLRRYRIDELPQIFNILKGEMSWIGPRPEAISLSRWYTESIPFYPYRHIVRPGVTGWAQVNQGHVADLNSVTEKLRYDFYYIKYFSFWLDALVTIKTLRVILGGFGAK